jgi:hypothetical protein
MLRESIRNKINRKNNNIFLGGWKARGIPKGGFGRVLARSTRKGKKIWYAGRTSLINNATSLI